MGRKKERNGTLDVFNCQWTSLCMVLFWVFSVCFLWLMEGDRENDPALKIIRRLKSDGRSHSD